MVEMRGSGRFGENYPDGSKEEKDATTLMSYLKAGEKVFTSFGNPDARDINKELLEMSNKEMTRAIKRIPPGEIEKIKISLNKINPQLLADAYGGVLKFKKLLEGLAI